MSSAHNAPKSLIEKGFELDKGLNRLAIAAGLGVAAVGAMIAAPAAVTFGAVLTGGSIAGLEVSKRIEQGYKTHRTKKGSI